MSDDLSRYLIAGAAALSIPIDDQSADQFIQYSCVLQEWNKRINLTSIEAPHAIIVKHFIDSIAPVGFGLLDSQLALLDVGSGAGFPGIPLKIIKPQLSVTLLEPNKKKLSFLLYVVGLLRLTNISVEGMTLQKFSLLSEKRFDLVATRAVNLADSMGPVPNVLKPAGTVLAYRSSRLAESGIPSGLSILNEWTYELPFDYGPRVLSQLGPAPTVFASTRG